MNLKKQIKLPLIISVMSMVLLMNGGVAIADDLQSAFQKEYAYLEEQKRNLVSRLASFKATSAEETKTLSRKIERLSLQNRKVQDEAQNLNSLLFESERTLEAAKDNKDIFSQTFDMAEETLKSYDAEIGVPADMASNKKVGILFGNAYEVLDRVRSVKKQKGSFYDADGRKVTGELLHLGQIASYGMSDTARGILVPAGDGEFKLWNKPVEAVAENLFADAPVEELKLFVYENRFSAIDANADKGVFAYIGSGGMVAWIIVMLGVLAAVLITLRVLFLRSASSASENILVGIKDYVAAKDISGALEFCKTCKGSTSRVVKATLRNLERDRDHLEDIVSENILHESPVLNRFSAVIIVIAAVTPLLGLLGTVTGMISTFDIITEFGTGDPKLLSGGISVALVSTQLGLAVAIPALILGNLLSGWSNRIKDEMEKAALNVINIYDAPQLAK
ncbi:MAG: MotA/TolQ/ExbB proton channel family protein [Gammaproteobacteria bacterium]|jgi:biopolymer transport protein ExbB|nr:MotA/TolQ/ExbB proton channel family protein [Gammaproteobacteria bacterium]